MANDSTAPLAIEVTNVSKAYHVWDTPAARLTAPLCENLAKVIPPPLSTALERSASAARRDFWALQDVTLTVGRGESVGIVGRNGSGKSTLLQIIAGTLQPTRGTVKVHGRVGALLELGSGFNPEFTGRENIALAAAVLGFPRDIIAEKAAWIEEFAEIGDYINQPLKTYSSGMAVRLAFATQIAMQPDVLIVDEALSVGDMFFEHKCLTRIKKLLDEGTSLLLVSHSLQTIKSICRHAILLSEGRVVMSGACGPVADRYTKLHTLPAPAAASAQSIAPPSPRPQERGLYCSLKQPPWAQRPQEHVPSASAGFVECAIFQDDVEVDTVAHDSRIKVSAWLQHHVANELAGEVGLVVRTLTGLDLFAVNSYFLGLSYPPQPAGALVRVDFSFKVILAPGKYSVSLGLRSPVQGHYLDKVFGAAVFAVVTAPDEHVAGFFDADGELSIERIS